MWASRVTRKICHIAQVGEPVLRRISKEVTFPLTRSSRKLIGDMKDTLAYEEGAGLAAIQIRKPSRLFIFDDNGEDVVAINPEMKPVGTGKGVGWEACLSVRGLVGRVSRFQHIQVTYFNEEGHRIERELSGFTARVFQHELDHCHGRVWLDHVVDRENDVLTEEEFALRVDRGAIPADEQIA
jgi:peptide deformylase